MLSKKLSKYRIILASNSPRRQELFANLDVSFTIKVKEVNEVYPSFLKQTEITDYLANLKATAFKDELTENDLLITSDTIVWLNNKALGKPKNYNEAFNMLKELSNTNHKVITSICLSSKNFKNTFNDITVVSFKELLDEEIDYYINTYKPYDKAGAYGIQEWIGKIGVNKIEGSYFNVMGLPLHKLYKELLNL